jgi:hypothetical protein
MSTQLREGELPPEFQRMCVENGMLATALRAAHAQIKIDRDSAFDCAYNHGEGCIPDPADRAFVAQYDEVLAMIELALGFAGKQS